MPQVPQELKNCLVWIATCLICLVVFLFFNYMFTQVLRFEGLGTMAAIAATFLILGELKD